MAQHDLTQLGPKPIFEMPILPLRDVVVYPHMVIPLFVGRKRSIKALEAALLNGKQIFLVAQKSAVENEPSDENLYQVGTVSIILQLLKLPDGTVKVLIEGIQRARIIDFVPHEDYMAISLQLIADTGSNSAEVEAMLEGLSRSLTEQFDQYVKLNKKIPPEVVSSLTGISDRVRLADTITAHLPLKLEDKQRILEAEELQVRLELLLSFLNNEIDLLKVQKRINSRAKQLVEENQRKFYLQTQMEAIKKELGELDEPPKELEDLARKIDQAGMSKEAKAKALSEFNKLKMMSPMSAEANVVKNYLDWLISLPWKKQTKISYDLVKAKEILEADHYGLEKVKERILEFLAVQQRVKKLKGPVLCLVGPPGVGKTSLGQSIAKATDRKFVRISLGGVRDEAEIRGHRRTYIGSMPGKFIQNLNKVKVRNPLTLLDEIDKMAMDFRGDPASALLEVLDPEQNHTFSDHYLEVDFDLSQVMFIATANSLNIPGPLLDRMEVIRIPGYTEDEKLHIALKHLIPKQVIANGLKSSEIMVTESAIRDIIRYYTREAGVRNLEREISKICRKVVKNILLKPRDKILAVSSTNLERYLGVKRFRYGLAEERDQIGKVTGLAWTEVGGELLTIEAAAVPGKGKALYTGQLGEVMQESIQAAMTVVRSRAEALNIPADFHESFDIHVHVPEGATPKDGPSAGIGMCTALVSALTNTPVRADVAMTGEITLHGEVLPIGGLKEKLLAAHRGGITAVIIPEENRRDLKEIPKNIKHGLTIYPVKWIDEVLNLALARLPAATTELHDADLTAAKITVTKQRNSLEESMDSAH